MDISPAHPKPSCRSIRILNAVFFSFWILPVSLLSLGAWDSGTNKKYFSVSDDWVHFTASWGAISLSFGYLTGWRTLRKQSLWTGCPLLRAAFLNMNKVPEWNRLVLLFSIDLENHWGSWPASGLSSIQVKHVGSQACHKIHHISGIVTDSLNICKSRFVMIWIFENCRLSCCFESRLGNGPVFVWFSRITNPSNEFSDLWIKTYRTTGKRKT